MRLWIALFLLVFAGSAFADVIGYNFVSDWPTPTLAGETSDGFSQWTDSIDEAAAPGTGTTVPNSTDPYAITTPVNAPGVSVAWSSANMWAAGSESDPDQALYRVYLDDGGGITITVSGLAAWLINSGDPAYQIRFYRSTDNAGAGFSALSLYDGAGTAGLLLETIPTVVPGDPSIGDGAYPTGTGGGGVRLLQDTLGMFTADTITFHSIREPAINGYPVRGCIAGFKITSIPEPAAGLLALMGLGLAVFSRTVRRRA